MQIKHISFKKYKAALGGLVVVGWDSNPGAFIVIFRTSAYNIVNFCPAYRNSPYRLQNIFFLHISFLLFFNKFVNRKKSHHTLEKRWRRIPKNTRYKANGYD